MESTVMLPLVLWSAKPRLLKLAYLLLTSFSYPPLSSITPNDRFGLGAPRVGFEGAREQEVREGPVQFEKDSGDVFGLDKFLDEAKSGRKRGLDTEVYVVPRYYAVRTRTDRFFVNSGGSRKRQQVERADERD